MALIGTKVLGENKGIRKASQRNSITERQQRWEMRGKRRDGGSII